MLTTHIHKERKNNRLEFPQPTQLWTSFLSIQLNSMMISITVLNNKKNVVYNASYLEDFSNTTTKVSFEKI
jgi:hypothetical protein